MHIQSAAPGTLPVHTFACQSQLFEWGASRDRLHVENVGNYKSQSRKKWPQLRAELETLVMAILIVPSFFDKEKLLYQTRLMDSLQNLEISGSGTS